jgi:hypothetical protein
MHSTLHDPLLTPENRLWRAVLEQAYADAESRSDAVTDNDDDGPPERIRARCYLRGDNKQEAAALVMVCGFAEIPADRVLNWARRNYPGSQSHLQPQPRSGWQNSPAINALEARHNRARSYEHASA